MNALTLDPADPAMQTLVADWQNGLEYDLTIRVKQTAPFKFDVVSATEAEPLPAEEAEPMAETGSPIAAIIEAGKTKKKPAPMAV